MPRTLYSPRLSDDVVRALYREGQRRRMPMTRLADDLLRQSLSQARSSFTPEVPVARLCEEKPAAIPIHEADAA